MRPWKSRAATFHSLCQRYRGLTPALSQRFRALQEGLAFRAEVARPAAVRAQGLGLGPVLLHEGEAALALLLAQDLAQHAAQRVDVAAEGVLVVIAGTGGRFHGPDCMASLRQGRRFPQRRVSAR